MSPLPAAARSNSYELADSKELAIDYPGGDAAVVAIVDRTRAFWPTMFGGGSGNLLGVGDALNGRVALKLDAIPGFGPRKEGCVGNRLELVKLNDPAVADAFGTDPDRRAACSCQRRTRRTLRSGTRSSTCCLASPAGTRPT